MGAVEFLPSKQGPYAKGRCPFRSFRHIFGPFWDHWADTSVVLLYLTIVSLPYLWPIGLTPELTGFL